MAGLFQLPSITVPIVHATKETGIGVWYPAGAQEQTLSISQGDGAVGTQVANIKTGAVDATDWPLTASQQGSTDVNCAGNTAIICSLPIPDTGYFEVQVNLANSFFGVPMGFGTGAAGIQLRQGIEHLLSKSLFAHDEGNCANIACVPDEQTNKPQLIPSPNPCGWDAQFPGTSVANCVVGDSAGTAYNCVAEAAACPTGTVTGTFSVGDWQPLIGSQDFCAAAVHFAIALNDTFPGLWSAGTLANYETPGVSGGPLNANCELNPPSGSAFAGVWPSAVYAINTAGCAGIKAATANTCFFTRTTQPRLDLGNSFSQEICALLSPSFGAWTTLGGASGTQTSCDNTNTGSANTACGGGSCPFLQVVSGSIGLFCGFNTDGGPPPDKPNLCWGMGTFGFGLVFPFDSTLYFLYNSLFTTEIGPPCASVTPSTAAGNYMYDCSATFDALGNNMEFASCLASTQPDPTPAQTNPTFANCAGGVAPGSGTQGSTSCATASNNCTAFSSAYQAEDYYGSHVFTMPIYDTIDTMPRLNNWAAGSASGPGISGAIGASFQEEANFFNWANAYSASAAVPGTFRQSFLTTVGGPGTSISPFNFGTIWESYIVANIYDSLLLPNPQCTNNPTLAANTGVLGGTCPNFFQNIDWMTTGHSYLCFPNGPACTSTTLGYTPPSGTQAAIQFRLNKSNHWQSGAPVTAWDVKYSFIDLNATGAFQSPPLSNVNQVNVRDEFTVDVLLKAFGPFTEFGIGGITIIPGYLWSGCGASTWNGNLGNVNLVGGSIVTAAQDSCVGTFASGGNLALCSGASAALPTCDVVAQGFEIGSGAWACENTGKNTAVPVGTIGTGCSIDNTDSPAFGLGDFTLTRTGCTIATVGASTATECGPAGATTATANCGGVTGATCEPDYFHSSGALARYIWTGDIGNGNADFSNLLAVNSCHSATPGANCAHWAQGIGNAGGAGANNVGLAQTLAVNSLKGVSWLDFSTETSHGTVLTFTCVAGYQIPGTTLHKCGAAPLNAPGWQDSVLMGIGSYATTLFEFGSLVLGTSTTTLSPATGSTGQTGYTNCGSASFKGLPAVGTSATAYPNGGYDC